MSLDAGPKGFADFPVTRDVIARLDPLVHALTEGLPLPVRVPLLNSFQWQFPEKTAQVVQVAKAVRVASGLKAAMQLADLGFTSECGTILRTVGDFSGEIVYLAMGLLKGSLTVDQLQFIDHHFSTLPATPDELAAREREYYVARKDILKPQTRFAEEAGVPAEEFQRVMAYLNKGYDAYVHGSHQSAMELYNGQRFMLTGHESARQRCMSKVGVANKLYEALLAFRIVAIARRLPAIEAGVRAAYSELNDSGEDTSLPCSGSE